MNHQDGMNTPMIALVGFLSALLVFFFLVVLEIWFYSISEEEHYNRVVIQKSEELTQVTADQHEKLYGYRWINEASKTVAIPIDVAMEHVASELE